jgi:hypothetical protein
MTAGARPFQVTLFSLLLFLSAVFMLFLGTSASAYYLPSVCLLITAYCLISARNAALFKTILVLNQITAIVLIGFIAYRKIMLPAEEMTLSISAVALIGNLVFGGPFLGVLSIPLLLQLSFGQTLSTWFNSRV